MSPPAALYRIVWSTETGATGQGEYCLTYDTAIAWLTHLRNKYPTITHSIESQPQPSSLNASVSVQVG